MKAILTLIAASTLLAAFAIAQVPPYGVTKVFTLEPSTHGNPEGVAFDPSSGAFFVGATADSTI